MWSVKEQRSQGLHLKFLPEHLESQTELSVNEMRKTVGDAGLSEKIKSSVLDMLGLRILLATQVRMSS